MIGTFLPRREIALARLAQASAQLEGVSRVMPSHIDAAAADMIGLIPITQRIGEAIQPEADRPPDLYNTEMQAPNSSPGSDDLVNIASPSVSLETTTAIESTYESYEALNTAFISMEPYPEDKAPIEREVASLRVPQFRYPATSSRRGVVTGVERATALNDLAVVNSLFAAAPFQLIRREKKGIHDNRLILSASDLRSYRRAPASEHMLLVLLDHTCLHGCNWLNALLPYLRKAYAERASIGIVQVGAANAANMFRAELVTARSVLVPSIEAALEVALEEEGSQATPLAHGFDLALRTLRHALQHGRGTVRQALFIVISDGRGNVPLNVSREEDLIRPINREGIDDTLKIAKFIRTLKDVRTVLLNPQPKHYPDLPIVLADVLGAEIKDIPRLEEV
jgi:magnesium chelatase subunit D